MSEHLPGIFRGATPDEASHAARAWARRSGLRVRTVATIRPTDIPDAWAVTLVVDLPTSGVLPDPPDLTDGGPL